MQTINNFRQLLIAKDIATTATAGTTIASPSTLANGEVAVTDMSNRVLANNTSGLTSLPYVKLVQGQGADKPLIVSPPIPKSATARAKAYVDYVEQVSYVGYNPAGSTGSFDALSNFGPASPIFRTTFKSNYFEYADKLMEAISGYMPMASDTISTFVDKLTLAMTSEIKKYVYIPFMVERVNSSTTEAVGTGGATNIIFTKGSSLVTWTGAITNLPVGTYFRLATGVNNVIYKVKEKNATSLVLDQPFQGATNTVSLVATLQVVTVNTTTGTAGTGWGIRLTGLLQSKFIANVYRYQMQKWVTTIQNMGTTTVSDYTKANDGVGTWYQIAEEEVFTLFSEGFADNAPIQVPPVTYRQNVVSGATYASIEVYWKDVAYNTTNVSDTAANFKQVKVAGACTYDAVNGDSEFVANSTFYDTGAGEQDVYSVLNAYLTTGVPTQGTFTAL